MKLATVFGASSSNRSTVISPASVLITAVGSAGSGVGVYGSPVAGPLYFGESSLQPEIPSASAAANAANTPILIPNPWIPDAWPLLFIVLLPFFQSFHMIRMIALVESFNLIDDIALLNLFQR